MCLSACCTYVSMSFYVPATRLCLHKCVPVSGMNLHQCICEGKCVCVCVCVLGGHDKFFSIQSWEMPNISLAKGRKGFHRTAPASARPHRLPPALASPHWSGPGLSSSLPPASAQVPGTHKVLRPLRPRKARPCTVSSWFPVSISSCTLAAPSNAPSLTSLIRFVLRFLERGTEQVRTQGGASSAATW